MNSFLADGRERYLKALVVEFTSDLAKLDLALERAVTEDERARLRERRQEFIRRYNERCDASDDCLY